MKNKLLILLFIISSSFSIASYSQFDASVLEPVNSSILTTSIPIRQGVVERVILNTVRSPYSIARSTSWGPASNIATAAGTLLNQISRIYISHWINSICSSRDLTSAEDMCYNPPSFKKGYFCISIYDNRGGVNGSYKFTATNMLYKHSNPDLENTPRVINGYSNDQICYNITGGNHLLKIEGYNQNYAQHSDLIFHRLVNDALFNGNYGGVIKNGQFHLVQKLYGYLEPNINTIEPLASTFHGYYDDARRRAIDKVEQLAPALSRNKIYDFFSINVKKINYGDVPSHNSFHNAITKNLPSYMFRNYSPAVSFVRRFRVTYDDWLKYPNKFEYHDIGKIYFALAPLKCNILDSDDGKQYAFRNRDVVFSIFDENTPYNIWDANSLYYPEATQNYCG